MLTALLTLANEQKRTETIVVGRFEICHRPAETWGAGSRAYRVYEYFDTKDVEPLSPKYVSRVDTVRLLMLHGVTRGQAALALAKMRLGV